MGSKLLLTKMESKSVSNKKRYDLISKKMRKLLPPFPFIPTKPRTLMVMEPPPLLLMDVPSSQSLLPIKKRKMSSQTAEPTETKMINKKSRTIKKLQIPHLNSPPMAAVKQIEDSIRRNNTPLPEEENLEGLMVDPMQLGLYWDQFVIMAPPLMAAPSSQFLLLIKKRKMPSESAEATMFETKMINKKRRTIKKLRHIGPILTMPAAIRETIEAMGGYNIKLVIQKILTDTDLNKNHGRLSLPPHQLKDEYFLTEGEEALLEINEEDKKKKGMTVRVFDGEFKESSMSFKRWKIGSRQTFCLMTQWNSFVREARLKANDEVQIWSFRVNNIEDEARYNDSNLCFIVIKILKEEY